MPKKPRPTLRERVQRCEDVQGALVKLLGRTLEEMEHRLKRLEEASDGLGNGV